MNSADFSEGGLTPEESRQVAQWLDAKGLDLIELSGGTYEQTGFEHKKESTKAREGYFVEVRLFISFTAGFLTDCAFSRAVRCRYQGAR
jgi:2,4-dienoyl-CoA reductase-like NADH-dependent reductase (Old Yellow Enzyme family)